MASVRATWREQLGSYQRYPWTEADGKVNQKIRIPVERAMEIVAKEGLPVGSAPAASPAPAQGASAK